MDRPQNHIITLEQKLDRLYRIVEQLSLRLEESVAMKQEDSYQESSIPLETHADILDDPPEPEEMMIDDASAESHHHNASAWMEHKDILLDDESHLPSRTATDGEEVSAEIQIRRLHTQLTAAYNRIAALEEQLLAQRIHF